MLLLTKDEFFQHIHNLVLYFHRILNSKNTLIEMRKNDLGIEVLEFGKNNIETLHLP